MKLLLLVGLISGTCLAQPVEGRWCAEPCTSSVVVGKFEYPAPKKPSPSRKKQQMEKQAVPDQPPQIATMSAERAGTPTSEAGHELRSVLPRLTVWFFSVALVGVAFAVPFYLVVRRRKATQPSRLQRRLIELTSLTRKGNEHNSTPVGPDENTPLEPADVTAALPVIDAFLRKKRR